MRRIATVLVTVAFLAGTVALASATNWGGSGGHHGDGASHIQYKQKKLCDLIKWLYGYHHGWSTSSKVKSSYGWYTIGWLIKFCLEGDDDCDDRNWSRHSSYWGRNDGSHDNEGCQAPPDPVCKSNPHPGKVGQKVTFDGSGSKDVDGTIKKYEWDLDANGSYESTGLAPTKTYTSAGTRTIKLRVTDNDGATGTTSFDLPVRANVSPSAALAVSPNPVLRNRTATFNASGSSDSDGTIKKYEWDLDGNGTFEVSGPSATASKSYSSTGNRTVKLRVTDDNGAVSQVASLTFAVR